MIHAIISTVRQIFTKNVNQHQFRLASSAANSSDLVTRETQGRIRLIGINRPEKKNCVNVATAKQLLAAFKDFDSDDTVDVAVLFGHGGTFCAGYDLKEVSSIDDYKEIAQADHRPMGPSGMLVSKPTIAAVNGYAVAGGLELALMCDLRVVEDTAVMGVFCRRFGVPLIDGGTVRLPKLIGLSRALDLILTGRGINAKEAQEIGLANRVVSCGTSLGQAVALANLVAKFPQECVKVDRASAYYASYDAENMDDAMNYELINGAKVINTESIEGAKKFVSGVGRHGSFNLLKSQL